MFSKVLVANRGAIACRIIRTLRKMKIASVAVYSEADRYSLHVTQADEAVFIGPSPANQSYLSIDAILNAARQTGAQAIHPGYGFLSENTAFARACAAAGIVFIGPTPGQVEAFALKHTARSIAESNDIPLLPGTGLLSSIDDALTRAAQLGYPVMLKSSGGGGGIGMRICRTAAELSDVYESVLRLSRANFGDSGVYLEKFVEHAKHIEVQIFGDGNGDVIALGERDCSAQRRHQKVLEETPAPGLKIETRAELFRAATTLCKAVRYASAGTVEFIYDVDTRNFYFLEVNTRLQVEHGVTEEVTGIDLVEWMILQAAGELPELRSMRIEPRGHSIEVRVYAEDPGKNFQPSPGKLTHVKWPAGGEARLETWIEPGTEITPFYDPMIAKLIVLGNDRAQALEKLQRALASCELDGIETNLRYLRQLATSQELAAGAITTAFLGHFEYKRRAFEVLDGGTQTTVQQYPGRLGYWHVGVPPSGPMDALAFRIANRLLGNPESSAALEMTTTGVSLRFETDAVIAVTGAEMTATVDGEPLPRWTAMDVREGSILAMDAATGAGSRAYLAIRGGIDVPEYLGSRSTFILGKFGGHAGRSLRVGDILHIGNHASNNVPQGLPAALVPAYGNHWELGVLFGPHTAPDFFTPDDIEMFFSTDWKVHYQIDRTGVRLIGPKPKWARPDGGEAGLHPSNIHDNAYAVGTVDFTGDMPILLGPDGPSLGGFVCPATVVEAELWKLGQLKAGDTVRFRRIALADAERMEKQTSKFLDALNDALIDPLPQLPTTSELEPAILRISNRRQVAVTYRADGDKYLLIEYGENKLDIQLRLRVHWLEQKLRSEALPGMIDITPGIRSLHLHYDNLKLPRPALLEMLDSFDAAMPDLSEFTVPSRIVHLPLSWDDPQARLAQQKYIQAVRPDAPWGPSNIEFIRRMNGLPSIEDVYNIAFSASYLVLGLGDVYLGAPVATPIDPRHRLITTKYNPARTWTPENAVGIGGAYLCVYGMEGPGGYQLIGRTVQVWNTNQQDPGKQWLLRFFDQIRFYPVSAEELLDARAALPHGRFTIRTEESEFSVANYEAFLASIRTETDAFKATQKRAFDEERERWRAAGQLVVADETDLPTMAIDEQEIPSGWSAVSSPVTASVFQIAVAEDQPVKAGEKLVVLDAMKTELVVKSPRAGKVQQIRCVEGQLVTAGQVLVVMNFE